jgi:hypothetical protein
MRKAETLRRIMELGPCMGAHMRHGLSGFVEIHEKQCVSRMSGESEGDILVYCDRGVMEAVVEATTAVRVEV